MQASVPGIIQLLPKESEIVEYILRLTGKTMQSLDINIANDVFRQLDGTRNRPVAVICDAAFGSKLMNTMKVNTVGKVYAINNRERMNDPGTNKQYKNDHNLYAVEEVLEDCIEYPAYSEFSAESHLHSSKYTIEMNPNRITVKGGTENVGLKFEYRDNKKDKIKDRLKNIKLTAKSVTNTLDEATQTEVQMLLFQKRCGDWLQVLSCLDKNRDYIINGERKNLKDAVVYFCSEDQVAIAYSVFLGINCIQEMSDGTYRVYKGGYNEQSLTRSRFQLRLGMSLENAKLHLQQAIRDYDIFMSILKPELDKITTSVSMSEIKECIKYAIHTTSVIDHYISVKNNRRILEAFIHNHDDVLFEEDWYQRIINSQLGRSNTEYTMASIRAPIVEETFALFDPTKLTYKVSSNASALYILYGQSILSHIVCVKELQPFVAKCIEKICELSEDENVVTLYLLFAEKYLDMESIGMSGGGKKYSQKQLETVGNILIQTLQEFKYNREYVYLHITKKHMLYLTIASIGETIVDHIIMSYKIQLMNYVGYIESQECPEDKWEIYQFLKIPKELPMTTYPVQSQTMIKARKSRRTRKSKQSRKSRKNH